MQFYNYKLWEKHTVNRVNNSIEYVEILVLIKREVARLSRLSIGPVEWVKGNL